MSTTDLGFPQATLRTRRSDRPDWHARLAGALELVLTWYDRARQRRQLLGLSDHMLHDLGIGRGDVEAEASKPFWRP